MDLLREKAEMKLLKRLINILITLQFLLIISSQHISYIITTSLYKLIVLYY
jgi:hypothetical protein